MAVTLKWFNKEGISGGTFLANLRDGVNYTDNYNEELDSAVVVLEFQDKIAFEPFDIVELTLPSMTTTTTKTMLIGDFVETQMTLDEPIKYQYTLNLISKTKELERVVLPNLSITKPKGGTAKTLYQACRQITANYSPKVIRYYYDEDERDYITDLVNAYQFSTAEYIDLDIPCPDLQITKPTLKDALNRILSINNSICYLNANNEILSMNLNERKDEIEIDEYYTYFPENQSLIDYATESENNYNNVVPNEIENVKNDSEVTDYIGFRTETMRLDDTHADLILDNPIYNLKEVKWCGTIRFAVWVKTGPLYAFYAIPFSFKYNGISHTINLPGADTSSHIPSDGTFYYFEIDITNYISEEQNFNILNYEDKKKHAYYSRGNNKIEGLLNYKKTIFENYITLEKIVFYTLVDKPEILLQCPDVLNAIIDDLTEEEQQYFDISNLSDLEISTAIMEAGENRSLTLNFGNQLRETSMFKITYQAQNDNLRMRSSKYLPERNQNNVITDNPGESYVDIKLQGELFNQKCNRLGNRVKYINARFPIDHYIPRLGDYLGDYVLIRRELQYFDDYILFKGTLTENYVNINYFTGINARKRSWNIVSAGEAFDKELLDKWYCELSLSGAKQIYESEALDYNTAQYLLNVFDYNARYIQHSFMRSEWTSAGVGRVELDLTSYISGNSLIFNFKTDDNYSLGIYITNSDGTGGEIEGYIKYVDNNGFANNFTYWLYPDFNYSSSIVPIQGQVISENDNPDIYKNLKILSSKKPGTIFSSWGIQNVDPIYQWDFYNIKDSREKLGFNIQFEFVSDTKDIILGEKFMERQQWVNLTGRHDYKIYQSDKTYRITDKKFKGGTQITGNLNIIRRSNNRASLIINDLSDSGTVKSIAITDSDNNLILAVNTDADRHEVWLDLHLFRTRDRNIYLSKDLKTWR